jgi:hypothetical protein
VQASVICVVVRLVGGEEDEGGDTMLRKKRK